MPNLLSQVSVAADCDMKDMPQNSTVIQEKMKSSNQVTFQHVLEIQTSVISLQARKKK